MVLLTTCCVRNFHVSSENLEELMLMELFRRVRGHPDVDKVDGNEKQMKFDIEELLVEFQDLLEQKCNDFCFGEDSLLLSDSSKHGG